MGAFGFTAEPDTCKPSCLLLDTLGPFGSRELSLLLIFVFDHVPNLCCQASVTRRLTCEVLRLSLMEDQRSPLESMT